MCEAQVSGMVWITLTRDWESPGQGILVDGAVLHDDEEVLVGICDEIEVLQGIAVDQKQVRERTLFHDTELARIGIALSGQRQQLGVGRGRHGESFGGGVQRASEARIAPCCRASAAENSTSVPHAVLI